MCSQCAGFGCQTRRRIVATTQSKYSQRRELIVVVSSFYSMMLNDNNCLELLDVGRLPHGVAACWRLRFGPNVQRVHYGTAICGKQCAYARTMGRKLLAFGCPLRRVAFNKPSTRHQPLSGNLRASRSSCTGSSRGCRTFVRCRTCSRPV